MAMTIHLRADGVSLLLTTDGGLPEVKHWGADLGPVTADDAAALFRAAGYTAEHNAILAPLRVGIVPEARHGWMGTPGLVGSRGG
ncbi:alpha-galactosidase, partial [Tessaracoccus lubricantis]